MNKVFLTGLFLGMMQFFSSCGDESQATCFSFEERSCAGDPWMSSLNENPNNQSKLQALSSYLKEEGVEVLKSKIETTSEIVCQACVVCPSGQSYFITIESEDIDLLESLDLLNTQPTNNCP